MSEKIQPTADRDSTIESYYALEPVQYGSLESLIIKRTSDSMLWDRFDVSFQFVSSLEGAETKCLHLDFIGVREFHLGTFDDLRVKHLTIDIRSIKSDQLEGLNYHIVENEENAVSFLCRDFSAEICDR
ncbi:MAG: hypothetical protein V1721_03915 [Pseudomonadota bacterium]